jgi:hypothetical protein
MPAAFSSAGYLFRLWHTYHNMFWTMISIRQIIHFSCANGEKMIFYDPKEKLLQEKTSLKQKERQKWN